MHRLLKASIAHGAVVTRTDAAEPNWASIFRLVFDVRSWVERNISPNPEDVAGFASAADGFVKTEIAARLSKPEFMARQAKALSISLPAAVNNQLDGWITENVSLIKSIDKRYFDEIVNLVSEAKGKGWTQRDLAGKINARYKVGRSRAKLIARDQIGKVHAQIDANRNMAAGVSSFRWVSSADERVRPLHNAIDGQVYNYPQGHPTEGLPGQPINCRCIAEPIFDDWEDD